MLPETLIMSSLWTWIPKLLPILRRGNREQGQGLEDGDRQNKTNICRVCKHDYLRAFSYAILLMKIMGES
jgi:hypothetical protein